MGATWERQLEALPDIIGTVKRRQPSKITREGRPCKRHGATERYLSNGHCVPCQKAARKRSADKHRERYGHTYKDRYPKSQAQRLFNFTLADIEKLAIAQNHQCAICGDRPDKLVIDHCHSTMKFRGLLCSPCNRGLGFFRDDFQTLENAARYVLGAL